MYDWIDRRTEFEEKVCLLQHRNLLCKELVLCSPFREKKNQKPAGFFFCSMMLLPSFAFIWLNAVRYRWRRCIRHNIGILSGRGDGHAEPDSILLHDKRHSWITTHISFSAKFSLLSNLQTHLFLFCAWSYWASNQTRTTKVMSDDLWLQG